MAHSCRGYISRCPVGTRPNIRLVEISARPPYGALDLLPVRQTGPAKSRSRDPRAGQDRGVRTGPLAARDRISIRQSLPGREWMAMRLPDFVGRDALGLGFLLFWVLTTRGETYNPGHTPMLAA